MAGATSLRTDLALPSAVSAADLALPSPLATAGAATPALSAPEHVAPEVMDQLALLLDAARQGGLSHVSSEVALQVVEAAEAVKAWADSVSVDATAAMVREFESDFVDLALEPLRETPASTWEWKRFVRRCRSAAARDIQVATGLPITQCQRRVWFSVCETERVRPAADAMRLGRVTLARAMALTEATAHLDAYTAAAIATRVLRPLTGPDGVALPRMAPLSEATFKARLHKQLVLAHGVIGEAERTYAAAVKARCLSAEPHRDGTGQMLITGDGPRIAAAQGRVDTIARRLRKSGDARTIAQLRADVGVSDCLCKRSFLIEGVSL